MQLKKNMAGYPPRVPVDLEPYAPEDYTHPTVEAAPPWADPPGQDPPAEVGNRTTLALPGGPVTLEAAGLIGADGRPVNPSGRTGLRGRGLLGKWGPNQAADPIVTRFCPDRPGVLQLVCVKRRDTGEWALPGGMTEGKPITDTLLQEFMEEATSELSPHDVVQEKLEALFLNSGKLVFQGVVDRDPRNTDNAWMETTVVHFHLDDPVLKNMDLQAGDDAVGVSWVDVTPGMPLYANHSEFVGMI
jgi:ADP-ribose pyrophosphatase